MIGRCMMKKVRYRISRLRALSGRAIMKMQKTVGKQLLDKI